MSGFMMTGRNRLQLILVISVASLFLVTLGMRIAYIKGDFQNPKQRPRATVEDISKHKQTIEQLTHHSTFSSIIPFTPLLSAPVTVAEQLPVGADHIGLDQHVSDQLPSRASPTPGVPGSFQS